MILDAINKINYFTSPRWWDYQLGSSYSSRFADLWASSNETMSPKSFEKMRLPRLKHLISHAYQQVPLYYDLYQSVNILPEYIYSEDDLKNLPLVTKRSFKSYAENSGDIAKNINRSRGIMGTTSGSTGEPFRFFTDKAFSIEKRALRNRFWRWAGAKVNAPKICCAPESARNYYPNMLFLHPHYIKAKKNEYIDAIRKSEARTIFGSPLMTFDLLWVLSKEKNLPRFETAILGGHTVSPGIRQFLEEKFQCQVFEFYATGELGIIAYECEKHQGMHIQEENTVVEIISDRGDSLSSGKAGRIILTKLSNELMPFIRYDIGDRGIILSDPCSCGRTSRRLLIEGRENEHLLASADGETISPAVLRDVSDSYFVHFQRYQFVQNKFDAVTLFIVPSKEFPETVQQEIIKKIKNVIPAPMKINIKCVPTIQPLPSGKFQYFVSNLWQQKFPETLLRTLSLEERIKKLIPE